MTDPDDIPERVTRLEREVSKIRDDAAAARFLAGCADRDVSELKAELGGHTKLLEALRKTQVEQGQQLREGLTDVRAEMREGFADVNERFDALEGEMNGRFAALEGQMNGRFGALEGEMRQGFSALAGGMAEINARLRTETDQSDES